METMCPAQGQTKGECGAVSLPVSAAGFSPPCPIAAFPPNAFSCPVWVYSILMHYATSEGTLTSSVSMTLTEV